jgi:hypothetical protein
MERKLPKRRVATILLFLSGAIVVLGGFAFFLWSRTYRPVPPPTVSAQKQPELPKSERRPFLHTIHLSDADRNQILEGSFRISTLSQNITSECDSTLQSAFGRFAANAKQPQERVEFAAPSQPFQDTDDLKAALPFRRLLFTGEGSGRCFIYYQHGGVMYPRFCLVVIDEVNKRLIWAGEARKEAHNLSELRTMLSRSDFYDNSGWVC